MKRIANKLLFLWKHLNMDCFRIGALQCFVRIILIKPRKHLSEIQNYLQHNTEIYLPTSCTLWKNQGIKSLAKAVLLWLLIAPDTD
ncbi:protein of unknown function [Legionella hackeliae]|uniref:Uncharacterized protein n=1 Tax=Legionella hackeliae TaxID=449 RepID=A0A0A8UQD6_LEGHA|nr:protein of unknown function [Legionella hackeliae]